jgi:dihydrolipoamide dehydrogenase
MAENFDVAVIGGGPGGYAAAIRCAQKGLSVAIVEKEYMGGTCLNCGCIPSKALLGSAHFLTQAKHANLMGLEIGSLKPNWAKIQARKDAIVKGFRGGVTGLVKSNNIKVFEGRGIAAGNGSVKIENDGSNEEITAGKIILATGSVPIEIPSFPFDGENIISSKEALSLSEVPESMVIIGGGVIGCELACVYACMGCEVTIIEALPSLLPNEDDWVGKLLEKELKKLGISSLTSSKVTAVDAAAGKCSVSIEGGDNLEASKVLVAVGRRACCDKETVEALGLEMDGAKIKVNDKLETSAAGVYAIGDAIGTTYLAHGAFMEAEVAADNAAGEDETMQDYHLIPRAVYTFPEVASVGRSEKRCKEMGIEVEIGKAPFRSNGRSVAHNETVGEIRVIRKKDSKEILGVSMVGATVTEMAAAARALIGSTEEITKVCFPHPTVSEVLKEAWEDAYGISLHVPPRQ